MTNVRLLSDRTASVRSIRCWYPLADVRLCPFAANDATEIVGQRRHPDTNQCFTLILHQPATTEPSHRDRDVWAAHTGEFGQLAVTHRHRDRVLEADGSGLL